MSLNSMTVIMVMIITLRLAPLWNRNKQLFMWRDVFLMRFM
jgi:hypothetical protein